MMLVAWKILWIQVLRIGISIFIFLVGESLVTMSYLKTVANKDYEWGESTNSNAAGWHTGIFLLIIIITGVIGFA